AHALEDHLGVGAHLIKLLRSTSVLSVDSSRSEHPEGLAASRRHGGGSGQGVEDGGDGAAPVEAVGAFDAVGSQLGTEVLIAQQGFDRRRPVVGVVVGDEQSRVAVFDDFGQSFYRRGDRGQSGGGRLGGDEPEGFAARGNDEHISGPIVIDEDVGGNGRADLDAGLGGDGGGQLPQIGRGAAAGQRGRRPGGASRVD